ncbi:MAG: OmpH family outer membrane protein [Elusimicrobiota bacterium]
MKSNKTLIKFILGISLVLGGYSTAEAMKLTPSRVAYVKVEKVFNELKRVHKAKDSLQNLIDDKKDKIEETEDAIEDVTKKLDNQNDELSEEEIENFEKSLDEKREDLKKLKLDSKKIIEEEEEKLRHNIMGEIYDTIKRVAEESDYTVILNKDMVLFSVDKQVDITDKIIREMDKNYE